MYSASNTFLIPFSGCLTSKSVLPAVFPIVRQLLTWKMLSCFITGPPIQLLSQALISTKQFSIFPSRISSRAFMQSSIPSTLKYEKSSSISMLSIIPPLVGNQRARPPPIKSSCEKSNSTPLSAIQSLSSSKVRAQST